MFPSRNNQDTSTGFVDLSGAPIPGGLFPGSPDIPNTDGITAVIQSSEHWIRSYITVRDDRNYDSDHSNSSPPEVVEHKSDGDGSADVDARMHAEDEDDTGPMIQDHGQEEEDDASTSEEDEDSDGEDPG